MTSPKPPTPQAISALLRKAPDRAGRAASCHQWSDTAVVVTWDLVSGIRTQVLDFAERTLQRAGYRTQRGFNGQEGTRLIVTAPSHPEEEGRP